MSAIEERVATLVEEHTERYPDMEVEDLYKLLYQAFVGVEVPITLPLDEWEVLVEEARAVGVAAEEWEEVIEVLDAERGLARVNLRPYLRAGGALDRLFAGYTAAAALESGALGNLEKAIAVALRLFEEDPPDVGFDREDLKRIAGAAAREGYPPRPHSAAYSEAYHPAYRLVLLSAMDAD